MGDAFHHPDVLKLVPLALTLLQQHPDLTISLVLTDRDACQASELLISTDLARFVKDTRLTLVNAEQRILSFLEEFDTKSLAEHKTAYLYLDQIEQAPYFQLFEQLTLSSDQIDKLRKLRGRNTLLHSEAIFVNFFHHAYELIFRQKALKDLIFILPLSNPPPTLEMLYKDFKESRGSTYMIQGLKQTVSQSLTEPSYFDTPAIPSHLNEAPKRSSFRLCCKHSILQLRLSRGQLLRAIDVLSEKPESEREAWAERLLHALIPVQDNPTLIYYKLHQAETNHPKLEEEYDINTIPQWDPGNNKIIWQYILEYIITEVSEYYRQNVLAAFLNIQHLEAALALSPTSEDAYRMMWSIANGSIRKYYTLQLCHSGEQIWEVAVLLNQKPESERVAWEKRLLRELILCKDSPLEGGLRLYMAEHGYPELHHPIITPVNKALATVTLILLSFVAYSL